MPRVVSPQLSIVYDVHLLTPLVWRIWTVLAMAISLSGLILVSPKISYGIGVLGKGRVKILVGVSFLVLAPMLVGVWRSGS